MGQCTGCTLSRSSTIRQIPAIFQQPADTELLMHQQLPNLNFQALLANIKVKKINTKSMSLKFSITHLEQTFILPKKQVCETHQVQWKFNTKFTFSMTEYQLKKSFLQINFYDKQIFLGHINANMFMISTGPYHHDFHVKLHEGQHCRICFDLRLSHLIDVQVEAMEAQIDFIKKHPGQKFCFSIKTLVNRVSQIASNNDDSISTTSYNTLMQFDERQSNKEIRSNKNVSEQSIKKNQRENLIWTKKQSLQMPNINMRLLASELHHAYFQILVWKINKNDKGIDKPYLFGQCYISFHKLFATDLKSQILQKEGVSYQQRQIQVNQKLWTHGIGCGTANYKFKITNQKYIKQMQVCVQTENGILQSSPILGVSDSKQLMKTCQQIKQMYQISAKIQENVIKLDKLQLTEASSLQLRQVKQIIEKQLQKLIPLLQKSVKDSIIIFQYPSTMDLLKAQKIFIEIGFSIIDYLEQEDSLMNQLCWLILIALIRRGELTLAHMGFNAKQKQEIENDNVNPNLKKKLEIALIYHKLILKFLKLALNSLNIKGLQCQRCFAEIFCSYAYFRLPPFRKQVLSSISRENDPDIEEWRGIQFDLKDEVINNNCIEDANTFTLLFDWQNNFYKYLPKKSMHKGNAELHEILTKDSWKARISKRGIAFFYFIKYWVHYVEGIVIKTRDIQWQYFPGYNRLLKSFFVELKKRKVTEYPDALKQASIKLLSNQKMLNPLITILFNKTNIYDTSSVGKVIEFVSQLFTALNTKKKTIPLTFNYSNFYKGLKIIIENEFSFAICNVLILIYNHFQMFHPQFRQTISMYLLGRVFFQLFLHWSSNVRKIFYHLLVYRIKKYSTQSQNNEINRYHQHKYAQEITPRLELLIRILDQSYKMKLQEDKKNLVSKFQKCLHRNMNKNLKKKRILKSYYQKSNFQDKDIHRNNAYDSTLNTLFVENTYNKFCKQELAKPILERYKSQVLQKPIIIALQSMGSHKKSDDVIRVNKATSRSIKQQLMDNTVMNEIVGPTMSDEEHNEFDVEPIQNQQISYLTQALKIYSQINLNYSDSQEISIPKLKLEVQIDQQQIRPEKIDDW